MGPFLMAAITNATQLTGGDAHFASTRLLSWELRGAFRIWLFRVACNMAIDFLTWRKHRPWAEGGDTAANKLVQISAQPDVSSQFDIEYRRAIFLRASEIVRDQVIESTWEAFHRTSVLQRGVDPPSEVLVQRNNISQASRVYATLP